MEIQLRDSEYYRSVGRQTDSVYLSSVETYGYKYNNIQNKNNKTKYSKWPIKVFKSSGHPEESLKSGIEFDCNANVIRLI